MATNHNHETLADARRQLAELGMHHASSAPHDHGDREYWAYGDGTDRFLDHSATITPTGDGFAVSLFERKMADGDMKALREELANGIADLEGMKRRGINSLDSYGYTRDALLEFYQKLQKGLAS